MGGSVCDRKEALDFSIPIVSGAYISVLSSFCQTIRSRSRPPHSPDRSTRATVAMDVEDAVALPPACCVCFEELDYNGSVMVQCARCAMHVHVKCYGVAVSPGVSDAGTWLCEPCAYMQGKPSPTGAPWPAIAGSEAQRMQPYCAICPTAGGALRQTDQPGVWCHVLCINWIPELSHSMTGTLNERVQISLLDRSRETLRCLICGQRGGCIQCVSGRCARAFHVMCAFRAPSTVVFTGYNGDNQQVYHCKAHLGDVTTRKFEMVEHFWRRLPQLMAFLQENPSAADGRCRVCQGKAAAGATSQQSLSDHEAQCLLSWLVRDDLRRRKEQMDALGVKPVEISYANAKHKPKSNGSNSRRASDAGVVHGSGAGKKRQPVPMRLCPECGESIRETLMSSHIKNRCAQSRESLGGNTRRSKNPRRKSSGQARSMVDLTAADDVMQQGGDLSDVVFASWPGQSAGNRMDATHLWKTLNHHFFTNRTFVQRRMEQLCKNLCGCKLDELCRVSQQALMHKASLQCSDSSLFERRPDDALAPLVLRSTLHRCDNIVRASRMRCMDDIFAKPCIEISHDPARKPSTLPSNGHAETSIDVEQTEEVAADSRDLYGDVRVRITNKDEQTSMDCQVAMYLSHGEQQPPVLDDGAVWSRFSHDAVCTLVGGEVEAAKVPMVNKSSELWVSLRKCDDVQEQKADSANGAVLQPDELTPSINLLMDQLKEQTKANRYRLRVNCQKLQLHEAAQVRAVRVSTITESYFREFASWKRLCQSLVIGYRDVRFPLVKPETTAASPSSSPNNGQPEDPEGEDQEPVDDGTCVVCFDGQSPESNPIIFCDRCDLAVHQRCYGVVDVPANEFYCDRCLVETVNRDSVAASTPLSVFCQLCSLPDGAFKQTIDGKWVHVVCALWCPNVWIGNLQDLSEISLVGGTQDTRFLNTLAEVEARVALSPTAVKPKSPKKVVGTPLQRGSLCQHCRVACGRTIRCSHEGCNISYHALCGWFDGLPMVMGLGEHGFVYGGGGAGLKFQLYCPQHLPEGYSLAERAVQSRRRKRFRIDAFSKQRKPESISGASPKGENPKPEGSILTRDADRSDSETAAAEAKDWTDMFACGACFEHSSPVVDDLPCVDTLTRRQFLVRCQSCNTFVHPECAITDLGSPQEIFSNNWICERCVMARDKPHIACIVCDKSTDYLMPCGDPSPPAINTTAAETKANGHASLISKFMPPSPNSQDLPALMQQQLLQQQQLLNAHAYHSTATAPVQVPAPTPVLTRSPSVYDEWIHMLCCKWTKAKTIRRQRILCANYPKDINQGLATRCELCSTRGVRLLIF